jgi:hypothetical protein
VLRDSVDRGVPQWVGVLQMAEAWGCHPQDIMEREGGLLWAARWSFYRKQVRWVEEDRAKKKK